MNSAPVQTPSTTLAGHYTLRPGVRGSVTGHRPALGAGRLGRLLRGQQCEAVVRTLGNVFTLCAHAHRRTARLALRASNPHASFVLPVESPLLLNLETARDHLRSMALDWPQRQSAATQNAPSLLWLRDCPLSLVSPLQTCAPQDAQATLSQLREWLESRLERPLQNWLADHRDADAFAHWCRSCAHDLPPARCLDKWNPLARSLAPQARSLDLLNPNKAVQAIHLQAVALAMATDPNFVQRPLWRDQCAETGVWTRLRHQAESGPRTHTAWSRLSARWLELLEIAAAPESAVEEHTDLLSCGALPLGEGQAIAWCEMARGLLLHWVQLDPQGRVEDYRVLAPTEWNFHPDGALAHALAALPEQDTISAWCLAAAFDPCVDCSVMGTAPEENVHA